MSIVIDDVLEWVYEDFFSIYVFVDENVCIFIEIYIQGKHLFMMVNL